jgi:hypothetical protein
MKTSLHLKLFLLALLIALTGCSTTTLLGSWTDTGVEHHSLKKPLVVAIVNQALVRKKLEDEFSQRFKKMGIDAIASHTLFPEMAGLAPDAVKAKLPALGCDSILVIRLIDIKLETVHVPARSDVYGHGGYGRPAYYGSYGGYYANSVRVVNSPAYNYVEKKYIVESNIYNASTEKIIWTGTTATDDTDSIDAAVAEFTEVLIKDIKAKSVF